MDLFECRQLVLYSQTLKLIFDVFVVRLVIVVKRNVGSFLDLPSGRQPQGDTSDGFLQLISVPQSRHTSSKQQSSHFLSAIGITGRHSSIATPTSRRHSFTFQLLLSSSARRVAALHPALLHGESYHWLLVSPSDGKEEKSPATDRWRIVLSILIHHHICSGAKSLPLLSGESLYLLLSLLGSSLALRDHGGWDKEGSLARI